MVIPCYRVRCQNRDVIACIPDYIGQIFVVEDACPEGSGVEDKCKDPRARVLRHASNANVDVAMTTGYHGALACGASTAIKIDGDRQMDPTQLPHVLALLLRGEAD